MCVSGSYRSPPPLGTMPALPATALIVGCQSTTPESVLINLLPETWQKYVSSGEGPGGRPRRTSSTCPPPPTLWQHRQAQLQWSNQTMPLVYLRLPVEMLVAKGASPGSYTPSVISPSRGYAWAAAPALAPRVVISDKLQQLRHRTERWSQAVHSAVKCHTGRMSENISWGRFDSCSSF